MCGIAGILFRDKSEHVDEKMIKLMCTVMRHRGPDEWGKWIDKYVGIGMTRLRIIDLDGGSQPIHNEDKSIWIVFNGEIYNYKELRIELEKRGHKFYTNSDTESIIHLYEEFDEECVHRLRGMFAFAIWDGNNEKLFLARDRLGIKPLYYNNNGKRFIFGSELKSILAFKDVPRKVHSPSLINYFAYGYVPDPETMIKGIYKLPPGNTLIYKNGSTKVQKYWDVEFNVSNAEREEYYIERILEILNEAVKIRLMSEVPLGAFLSGGIDSSLIVAIMAKHMSEPVKTFTIGFENQKYDELKYARMVAERYNTDHHEEIVKPDAKSIIIDLVKQFDEPFADSSAIPTYYVCQMAKKWVTVSLSGDGGDELFGGYGRYIDGPIARFFNKVPESIKLKIFMNLSKILPEWCPGINVLRHISVNEDSRYIRKLSKGTSTTHKNIFSNKIVSQINTSDPSAAMLEYMNALKEKDQYTKRQYVDIKTYLPGDILTKVDRTSMMVSLEARVPILDHKLVEFSATIPPELKIKGMTTKYILKKAAERLLPKDVIYRPKMGFAVPISEWINKDWFDISYELVQGKRALSRNNFSKKYLKRLMLEHKLGRRDHGYLIWTLMVLELWYREKIDL
jgi:asparagine synthase (glutamine-hydrolysing)